MRKFLLTLASAGLLVSAGTGAADEHEGEESEANVASPMEIFTCKYNKGQDRADLDVAIEKWNKWADKAGLTDYSAWILAPYYSGPEQDFDVIWLGGSEKAKAMGRAQDAYVATGAAEQRAFDEAISCDSHGAFSVLRMKKPPERENPSRLVVSFSDCDMADGVRFEDLYMPLREWGKYKGENGSTAGMWVFFSAFGGGGEEYDFKWVTAHQNLEDLGADWDQYNESGWEKAGELFADKLSCDSSRTYIANNVRRAEEEDE